MSKRRRREIDIFNMSFLDVVSCGFGAIILLLVIIQIFTKKGTYLVIIKGKRGTQRVNF